MPPMTPIDLLGCLQNVNFIGEIAAIGNRLRAAMQIYHFSQRLANKPIAIASSRNRNQVHNLMVVIVMAPPPTVVSPLVDYSMRLSSLY